MKKDYLIKNLILQAQSANELAHLCRDRGQHHDKDKFYKIKDSLLHEAISFLNCMRHSDVSYRINKEADQNGQPSNIIYFEWKDHGHKYQFSFHSFSTNWKISGNKKIRWNGIDGQCELNRIKIKYRNIK